MRPRRSSDEDIARLERWLDDWYPAAYRTAFLVLRNRQDAEEAVQEAYLRVWRFRTALPGDDGVRPWLYRVVVNSAISKLRSDRNRRARVVALDGPGEPATESGRGPEDALDDGETRSLVLDALGALPDDLRVVVVLRYYAQLSEKEIATAIGRRPGTVKSRLHEARVRLGRDARLMESRRPVGAGEGR